MALANDNYYGYVASLLVTKQVTWLECAAASLFWSTILVYYLEKPYGHLVLEGRVKELQTAAESCYFAKRGVD